MSDLKYEIRDGKFVNRVSGEAIPDDEPIFVLRARDWLSVHTLREYLALAEEDGCKESHLQNVRNSIIAFMRWARLHSDKLKQPGITEHVKVNG